MGGDGVWWAEGVKKEVQAVYNGDDLNEATGGQRILLAGGWTLGLALWRWKKEESWGRQLEKKDKVRKKK